MDGETTNQGIQPEETDLPEVVLGEHFDIIFSSSSDITVYPLFDIEQHNITIDGGNVSGSYSVPEDIIINTISNYIKHSFNKFSDIPDGHEVYRFVTSSKVKQEYLYEVSDESETKLYTHEVFTNWTALSSGFRDWMRNNK